MLDTTPIGQAELFSTMLDNELTYIYSRSGILQLRSGGRLFSAGDKADRFYLLQSGGIRVFKTRSDGGEDEMARYESGDTVGDFDFARRGIYDASACATCDTVLIVFPGVGLTMDILAAESPNIVARILLNSIMMITSRIKSTQKIYIENSSWVQELRRQAYEDPGTGLWKQSFLFDEINRILEDPTALIMIKPDRFKILVDSRGHGAGDEAMVRIAMVLKNINRRIGRGWALRFKSNEAGILINKCGASSAEKIAREIYSAVSSLDPVPPSGELAAFPFSCTVSYALWPGDEPVWDALFQGNYGLLLDTWKNGGNRIVRYAKALSKEAAT
ncbi:MAG: diguanylate cyclase [Spirochaetaceae bacterium]|jgi:diguanylate cyclase (GGDEF)-like protein|nr:diguanylate cyclase [Spirochaetaceae bacterium]